VNPVRAMRSMHKRLRDYALEQAIAANEAERERVRRSQPEWERRWGAPDPGQIRDAMLAILDAHGVLEPGARERFCGPSAAGPANGWAMAVLTAAIRVDGSARFIAGCGKEAGIWPGMLVYRTGPVHFAETGGDDVETAEFFTSPGQDETGATFAELVLPFAAATGGDWQPRALRSNGSRTVNGGRVTIDFESGGRQHHWELSQDWADGVTADFLGHITSFAAEHLPGRFLFHDLGGYLSVVYAPGGPADEAQAFLRRWPSPEQLSAMVRQSDGADTAWPEHGGSRICAARERLGLQKPDYSIPAADGTLPLGEAARLGRYRAVQGLIYDGADPALRDGNGKQAIDLARDLRTRELLAAWMKH
jgi:hypothetical protein